MRRLPVPSGSRLAVVTVPDDAVVLRPQPVSDRRVDIGAAVRDALRFPLSGSPREALAAAVEELERLGVPSQRLTILVAGGLNRRAGQRELEALLPPQTARRFHGRVEVHDTEGDLVALGEAGRTPLRISRLLVETDLVVAVTAAETVLHGGAGALLGACGPETLRAATAYSLLETAAARGWQLALAVERALAARVPVIGTSLVLDTPRLAGRFRGFPYHEAALEQVVRSPLRRFSLLPSGIRRKLLDDLPRELAAVAAFAGPPSVAHAEALLRAIDRRATPLDAPLDAIVIGMPWQHHHAPRERLNPITVATIALGLALRLWRDAFPVADGGTAILLHQLSRHFAAGTQDPYRELFHALRDGRTGADLAAAEREAATDERALAAYRRGRACHPLLPYLDWESCRPALDRLGAVVVAGCRDHAAARTLGFVPTHGIPSALEMAHGRAGDRARVGYLLSPPYFPLAVGT